MMDTVKLFWHDYLVLFAMVNAVGNLPVFSDLTHGMSRPERSMAYRTAVMTGGIIVLVFALFGNWMLQQVFEVTTADFKIAGGILVFAVAARGVLLGGPTKVAGTEGSHNLGVFPLGFPFLAGPGTIVTTIMLFQRGADFITLAAVIAVYLTILPILFLAPLVERTVGRLGVMVITRLLYIFIGAKAVHFIMDGVRASMHSG